MRLYMAIQVCYDIENENTLKRKIEGLKESCKYFNLKEGYIITFDQKEELNVKRNLKVYIISAYEFILRFLN